MSEGVDVSCVSMWMCQEYVSCVRVWMCQEYVMCEGVDVS